MDFDRVREFLLIAEEGSIKAAAGKLKIAPNVLSSRLKTFERNLGTTLMVRNAHGIRLTENGKIFFKDAKKILAGYEDVISTLDEFQGHTYRSLRLQLFSQTLPSELGPFLDLYCRRYPRLFLELSDENNGLLREGLSSGKVDIAFAPGRADAFSDLPGRVRLDTYPLMNVYVPNDHPLAGRKSVTFSELDDETFILYPKMADDTVRALQLSILEQAAIRYNIYDEDCSPLFFDLLVPIGRGIRLWNWLDKVTPNTQLIPIADSGYEVYSYMLYLPDTKNRTALDFIQSYLAFRKEA